jgi:phosphatidylserine/phosphatidylglycerophosphate/cardiolipin synthase-like enzyme
MVAGIASEELARYISEIAEADAWQVKRDKEHEGKTIMVGNQKVEFWALPAGENGVNRISELIQGAKKSIRVAMFTWTRQDFANAIIQAKLKGIDVQVAIDQGTSKGASSKIVKLIASKGIPIYHNHAGSLLHHKFLFIDDITLVNGSANWTKAAFQQNKDCFIVIHDLSEQQRRKVQSVWNAILRDAS